MIILDRPLVMVHGLWNTPRLFRPLVKRLQQPSNKLLIPHLPHQFGRLSLMELGELLNSHIIESFGSSTKIDILGFSMGGVVSRVWLQMFAGSERTIRFISIASPHRGTLTAQLVPAHFLKGIAEMKIGSKLLFDLDKSSNLLNGLECISFYSPWDLMVFPGWRAKLPIGRTKQLNVFSHRRLISSDRGVQLLAQEILRSGDKPE